jgi:phosphoserine phosphatase RsbU/P
MLARILKSKWAGYLAGVLGIAVVTAICMALRSHANDTTVALAMLLVVLFVATAWGVWPAFFTSVVGMLSFNFFFLPPIYTLTIADPRNWIALAAFFITAIIAGQLSERAKRHAAEAEASRQQARLASVYNRSLLEASLDPLMTIGLDGKINDVNAAAETATGCSRAELIGTEFADHFTEREKARAAYEQVFRDGSVRGYALQLLHRAGHSTSVLYDGSLYRDADGNVIGVVAATRPIRTYEGELLETRPDPRVVRHLSLFVRFASLFSVAVGLLSIVGLTFQIAQLKSILPGKPVIKMNAAVCLVLLGLALLLLRKVDHEPHSKIKRKCGQIIAGVVALVGLLNVTEHLFGWNLHIDQLLFREPAADAFVSVRPGLIAPITALDFLFLGLALVLLDRTLTWRARQHWPAQYFASLTAILSLFGLLDFLLGSPISYTRIALQTAVTLLLLSFAVLCVRTERGLAALLASSTAGGALTRRLLPAAIIIPIVIGALSWKALFAGRLAVWGALSLMIVAMITLLGAFAIWNGYIVERGDLERGRAEGILHRREAELREAQRLAQVGSWWWDPRTDRVTWSEGLSHIAGRDPLLPPLTYKEHLGFFASQSSVRLATAIESSMQTGAPFELDLEIVRLGGTNRLVTGRGEVEHDAEGQVALVRGTVQDVTDRKHAEEALQKSAEEMRDLYNHAPCGYHSLDKNGVFVRINDTELAWLGYTREEVIGKMNFSDVLAPESFKSFQENFPKFKKAGEIRDIEFDMVRKDGTILPVLVSATAIVDADGNYLMSRSTVYDISGRKQAEKEIRLLAIQQAAVADLGQRALRSDPFGKVLDEAVVRAAQILGIDYARVLELQADGKTLLLRAGVGWKEGVVGHATVSAGTETQAGFALSSKGPVILEDLRTEKRFKSVPMFGDPDVISGMSAIISTSEGPYGIFSVHTKQRRTFTEGEVNFLQSVANVLGITVERRRVEAELWRINLAQRALSKCNQALVRATDESALLQQICDIVVEEAGYRFCWVGRAENDETKSILPLAKAGFEAGYLDILKITWADTERGQGPTGTCIRTRQTVTARNIATDPRMGPWREEALKRGYASSVSIPLLLDSTAFGAFMIYATEPDSFGTEEVKLLTELASDLAFGVTTLRTRAERAKAEEQVRTLNAELEQRVIRRTAQLQTANKKLEQAREREIDVGYRIQQTLLLDHPPQDVPGLRVAALSVPSEKIDGDFYIFIKHQNQSLDVIVGDVMGKGIPAALLGAATKSHFLKALSDLMDLSHGREIPEPKEIVMLAHAGVVRDLIKLESFVTLSYARLDAGKRKLELVDCGHTGVLQLHGKTGQCEVRHGNNLPLGVREGEIYDQSSIALETGDLLLLFSDGITEARNSAKELFGVERLEECVANNQHLEPAALVDEIRKAVFNFSGSDKLMDDLTSVVIRVEEIEQPVARAEVEIRSDLAQLRRAREFVRRFCGKLPGRPLDEECTGALELAVNEAASNIMKHGYHGRTDQSIHLEGEAFPDRMLIRLHHFGDPFDPSKAQPPALDGSRESGFGVYLITQSTDDVRYYRDERGRNCVELVKLFKS